MVVVAAAWLAEKLAFLITTQEQKLLGIEESI